MNSEKKCYFCGGEATTREHTPPKCFFPENTRKNLITVPSCPQHNNGKSGDDEYFRMMVIGAVWNDLPESIQETIVRSVKRKPKLAMGIITKSVPKKGGCFTYDSDAERTYRVIESIARGLLYHEHNKIIPSNPHIISDHMELIEENTNNPSFKFKIAQSLAKDIFNETNEKWKGSNDAIFCYKTRENVVQFKFYQKLINTVIFQKC